MKLKTVIQLFFGQYLPNIKGASEHTAASYRDTFSIFLPFASEYLSVKIGNLAVTDISFELILSFLDYLENDRKNIVKTRNLRLAALKSLAKMIRLMYPEYRDTAVMILSIPQKREAKPLLGFLHHDEVLKVFEAVDLRKKEGVRDYTILHLLYDSGARASEIASLNVDYFDPVQKTIGVHGKGNRYRLVQLWPKTVQLVERYVTKYRTTPKVIFKKRLFINQRGEELTRHGIHRLCRKYLSKALPDKRLKNLNAAHCFRHSCAMNMLSSGIPVSDIKNHLGHEDIQSTMIYLNMDVSRRRDVQKKFIEFTKSVLKQDPKIEELIEWEDKEKTLEWLDTL